MEKTDVESPEESELTLIEKKIEGEVDFSFSLKQLQPATEEILKLAKSVYEKNEKTLTSSKYWSTTTDPVVQKESHIVYLAFQICKTIQKPEVLRLLLFLQSLDDMASALDKSVI